MKQFWQMMLSFTLQELLPVTILAGLPSTLCWSLNPKLGAAIFVVETGAALLHAVSFIVIGRFLQRQWTDVSPYVYRSGFNLLAKRTYLGIEETDHAAFSDLLKAVRGRGMMTPLRPWLLISDTSWNVLLVTWLLLVTPLVLAALAMTAFSRLMGRTFKMHGAHGL